MRPRYLMLPLAVAFAATASAQNWADDFDSYAAPSALEGQGGWKGWDAVNTTFTQVESPTFGAHSGSNCISINVGSDTVHEYAITSGVWNYTSMVYIEPSYVGDFAYMLMNEYSDGGPKQWGTQIDFRGMNNPPDIYSHNGSGGPGSLPLIFGQWVELRKRVDLNSDFIEIFYDGQLLDSYVYTTGYNGSQNHAVAQIEAIDLYPFPTSAVQPIYFDSFSLTEETGTIGTNFECPGTVPNSSGNNGLITATGSDTVGDNDVLLTASGLPTHSSAFGYFLNSLNQNPAGFVPPGSQGRLCIGPAGMGRYNASVFNASGTGEGSLVLDLAATPTPAGNVAIQAGETWYFTAWFRDNNPGSTSNFTDAVCITFQ